MSEREASTTAVEHLSSSPSRLWRVAVEAPIDQALTYQVPVDLLENPMIRRGQSVVVPLGRRKARGVLLTPTDLSEEGFELKDVSALEEERPPLPDPFLKWLEWLSAYYLHPIGQVVEMAHPPLAAKTRKRRSKKSPVLPEVAPVTGPKLTAEQAQVIADINIHSGFQVHLVHGVTGSGKTEVYIQLLNDVIQKGQQGLVLVPEIALTPQLIERFSVRFGDAIAVIHSHLTPRERTDQWWQMLDQKKKILIGARSALFCPLRRLGLIVIDEEHESSFKQDEKLKYHARDASIMLGKLTNCPVILGSATPSLESWSNAKAGRYYLHQLKSRVADRSLPSIEVVDMRKERDRRRALETDTDLPFWLGKTLYHALQENFVKGRQSALFLNRRGMAQSVVCRACGHVAECPDCAVKLTLHGRHHLLCHYCHYHISLKDDCPKCPDGQIKPLGLGTEMVQKEMTRLFPNARLARMDRDEITTREELEAVIRDIEEKRVDILIGTQMIAKGLDFPGLTLVGLVMADVGFNLPDFRASERSFQLLTQVSGRSGRHLEGESGQVIIQTYNPQHPSIVHTCKHDFEGFAQLEESFRRELKYPPYWRLAQVRLQGTRLDRVKQAAHLLHRRALALQSRFTLFTKIEVLGPSPAPLSKIRSKHRWHLIIKGPDPASIGSFCRKLTQKHAGFPPAVNLAIDMDSVHLL